MKFKQLLKDKNITQTDFAKQLGVSVQLLNNWVKGRSRPNYETVKDIATILKITVEEVIDCFITKKCSKAVRTF